MVMIMAVIMPAVVAMRVPVAVIMPAIVSVGVAMAMIVIMTAAVVTAGFANEKIEDAEDAHADAAGEHQRAEQSVIWQVMGDATAGVKVEKDAAPEDHQGNAD